MGTFSDATKAASLRLQADTQEVFVGVSVAFKNGWVEGSAVTGAPALPVRTGNLRAGVQLEFVSTAESLIATNVGYAPHVEENVRGVEFRNGGPHGLALMIAGFPQLTAAEVARLKPQGGA